MVRRNNMRLETAPPVAYEYGILSPAVTVVYETSDDWLDGFEYETIDGVIEVTNQALTRGTGADQEVVIPRGDGTRYRTYYPFNVQASIESSTAGTTPEEQETHLRNATKVAIQKAVEAEFWKGTIAKTLDEADGNRYLSRAEATDVTPVANTAVKVKYGLALLEQALGNATIGSAGVIHAPILIATNLGASDKDGALTTTLGNKVVAGAGYSNIGPDGTVAPTGSAWMYATGPVTVRLAQEPKLVPTPGVNHRSNTIEYFLDTPAAVTWSTTNLYTVLVDLELDYA